MTGNAIEVSDANVPIAPSNLVVQANSESEILLNWVDNSTDETGFKIERAKRNGAFTETDTVPANTTFYIDSGLGKNTPYRYRVRAYNLSGDSEFSNTATATTLR